MRYSRVAFSVLILAALCGCPTAAQRQFQAMKTGIDTAGAQIKACTTAVYDSPEFAPLRSHQPQSIQDATLQQLSDNSMITPAEWQAVLVTHPRMQQCRKEGLEALATSQPGWVPILTAEYNQGDDDLIALSNHKFTWGQYITRVRDRAAQTRAALQAEAQRVVEGLKQENAVELQQRQRAAEAIANWAQAQEMINAANRPVITNCNSFGSTVNCVSH